VARRKRKKSRTKRISFKRSTKKKKRLRRKIYLPSLMNILKVAAVVGVIAAVGIGFFLLDKYVKKAVPVSEKTGTLELVDPPPWVNDRLKGKIYTAAIANDEDLKLDEDVAQSVQQNIEDGIGWLAEVQVRVTHESIRIEGRWRKPLALVKRGLRSFYVDVELVVLDFVPMPELPIVKVKGLAATAKKPTPGRVWQKDDLAAAVAILDRLDRMDKFLVPDKPLLLEIDSIDVSNFNGRRNNRAPHIILYATDNTEIIWGAELDKWQRYLEAMDEEKLTNLYAYYEEHGSLLGGAKYINLQYSQVDVSLPVDKY
jgi:hypothetical protein